MVNKKRISIIGHFGGKETLLDGQTVKTKILYKELSAYTDWHIWKVDTYYRHKAPWKLAWQLLIALIATKDIIVITSQNGRRFFFPILYCFAKVFGTRIYHDVIGAKLAKYTVEYPSFRKYLNAFQVNWVETNCLKRELENVGVLNAEILPNFKRLQIVSLGLDDEKAVGPYRLCTFSRVMQEKGIEDAVNAVVAINEQYQMPVYTLDIFGPVDPNQIDWFEKLQKDFPAYISYRGKVHYTDSVETLKDFFAVLFPTRFFTEGVPGTIIDAYAAGVPVIASRWQSFSDVVEHGVTGYGYSFGDERSLHDLLVKIAKEPELVIELKRNCVEKAKYYQPEESVAQIIKTIAAGAKPCAKR